MPLTAHKLGLILDSVHHQLGSDAQVVGFGSRLDLLARGGDVAEDSGSARVAPAHAGHAGTGSYAATPGGYRGCAAWQRHSPNGEARRRRVGASVLHNAMMQAQQMQSAQLLTAVERCSPPPRDSAHQGVGHDLVLLDLIGAFAGNPDTIAAVIVN